MDASIGLGPAHKKEIFLKDYTPPDYSVDNVRMLFKLFDDTVTVIASTDYHRIDTVTSKNLVLNGGPFMDLVSLKLNGAELQKDQFSQTDHSLTLFDVPNQFNLTIETHLNPKENTRLSGLYWSGGNFCTQCEAEGFRDMTYFMDRPDVMAPYSVRIEGDKQDHSVMLSNGNPVGSGDLASSRHYVEWDDPHAKPSYLFALVAGNLARVHDTYKTINGDVVDLNIYVRSDDVEKCDYAMQSLKRSMKWDEDVYGLAYDLSVYNIVAVSDFNMGAMENKGLNIFNTKYVLATAETATDTDFDHVEGVIGHEYFHNWTGNRVTCRDWFQLSLKEGLTVFRDQEFSSDMTSRAVKRLDDVRTLRTFQFQEDSGPLAHNVRPESYIEINNFYTSTVYNKGAEVIRMIHTIIGANAFRDGMDLYFERHDGCAVTCEDFVVAMEDASDSDLSQFRLWYSQAGTPHVSVVRQRDGDDVILTLKQMCSPTPGQIDKKPLHMPIKVGWVGPNGDTLRPKLHQNNQEQSSDEYVLMFNKSEQSFRFSSLPNGCVPSLLRNFSAPITLQTDLSFEENLHIFQFDSDAFTCWEAGQSLASQSILGELSLDSVAEFIAAVGTLLDDTARAPALTAELLTLPSEIIVGQKQDILNPEGIHYGREDLIERIAHTFKERLIELYYELNETSSGEPELQMNKGRRRLKNVLLGYIGRLKDGEKIVCNQYKNASTMTDIMAAFSLITSFDYPRRDRMIADFYDKWHHNDLVIDKWFSVQAQSPRLDTIETIKSLLEHDAFSILNPNRLRALVSSFSILNQRVFHNTSGEGYQLLADMIIKVDSVNPQTAARLISPLGKWKNMPAKQKNVMKSLLNGVLEVKTISNDVKELVLKSLRP